MGLGQLSILSPILFSTFLDTFVVNKSVPESGVNRLTYILNIASFLLLKSDVSYLFVCLSIYYELQLRLMQDVICPSFR